MKDKTDIDFIKDQVKYLNSIKNEIHNVGEVILTRDEIDTLDKIAQTLTSFKFFLISDYLKKKQTAGLREQN